MAKSKRKTFAWGVIAGFVMAVVMVVFLGGLLTLGTRSEPAVMADMAEMAPEADEDFAYRGAGGAPAGLAMNLASKREKKKKGMARLRSALTPSSSTPKPPPAPEDAPASLEAPATRSWFPETFLFEPRVKTDANGRATVQVKVPDRLTTWRVLALAHDRQGSQAGAVTSFLGTLPVYVDPVVPPFLRAGDEVELPVQVVNTTREAMNRELRVKVEGATLLRGAGRLSIGAQSSLVQLTKLQVEQPGELVMRTTLPGADATEHRTPILATGRPQRWEASGTLAAERTLSVPLPASADPYGTRVRLQVFPGGLALLKSELSAVLTRSGVAEDAYALQLAGQAPKLLKRLGGDIDPRALRRLKIVASQRVLRAARAPGPADAMLMGQAAGAHPDDPVLARLATRLSNTVLRSQRPDGTFQGATGWTLQRLMVATAQGVSAVRPPTESPKALRQAEAARLRAEGAFERSMARVKDPYTAAVILAAGGVRGELAKTFAGRVKQAVTQRADGTATLQIPEGVVRADGVRPSDIDGCAWAVLALAQDKEGQTMLPDLGSRLVAAYRPGIGWGDGRTNLVALSAVLQIFDDPLPSQVKVTLTDGEAVIVEGRLQGDQLKDILTMNGRILGPQSPRTWTLSATPPVPGLGFSAEVEYFVPWDTLKSPPGFGMAIDRPSDVKVGQPVTLTVRASAPARLPLIVRQALPAGVKPDPGSLDKLQQSGQVSKYETEDGAVILSIPSRPTGRPNVALTYRVVPTVAGRLQSGASLVYPEGLPEQAAVVPPTVWSIR